MQHETVTAWQHHLSGPFTPSDLTDGGTLPAVWAANWAAHPRHSVLLQGGTVMSGEALERESRGAAGALAALGVGPGDRVLWSGDQRLDSIVWMLGALRLGAVVVPFSPSVTASELAHVAGDVRPVVAIVGGEEQRALLHAARSAPAAVVASDGHRPAGPAPALDVVSPEDDALIVYTSGTTGKPKGAVHTHRSLLAGVEALRLAWGWQGDDRLILALPLFHVHGLCAGLFGSLAAGGSALILDRFTPGGVLDAAADSTMFFGVPTMYHRLAESGRVAELSTLRLCVSGSAALPIALWQALHEHGVDILERYGMSETLLTLSNPLRGERRAGTVGFPLPGTDALVEGSDEHGVGRLLVRGPSLCRGYWERPDDTAAAWAGGWFVTGDLASVDEEGYFSIRGRLTELIITGGHNVYPAEVEAVLGRHPSVKEVAVVGVPSAEWGESVIAFVVGVDGSPDVAGMVKLAEQELAPYKRPRDIHVVDALPRNALGKVLRRSLGDGGPPGRLG